jgi:hypothetical protein
MAVIDDLRRLMQLDFMFLGIAYSAIVPHSIDPVASVWHKGRIQQANDGSFIFRSISQDGTVVGVQLGRVGNNWTSSETVAGGINIQILVGDPTQTTGGAPGVALQIVLAQSLPPELT